MHVAVPEIDIPLVRKLLYDAHEDGCCACQLLGLFPMADDQAVKEHEASDERVRRVTAIIPTAAALGAWLAKLNTAIYLQGEEVTERYQEYVLNLYISAIVPSIVASISVLVDAGTLRLGDE